jgi:hypothetical protein
MRLEIAASPSDSFNSAKRLELFQEVTAKAVWGTNPKFVSRILPCGIYLGKA